MNRPFAIVTDINKVVRLDVLKRYQNDAKSQQLEKSVFANEYKINRLVEPLYEPLIMSKLLELNTYHMRACKQKSLDIAGKGWELVAEKDNPNLAQKTKVEEFFDKQETIIEETFRRSQMDIEATGYSGVEVVRQANGFEGEVALINHLPAYTLRVHEGGHKYCQKWNNKKVWFRDFDYEKDIDKDTGDEKEANSLDSTKRGTEIFWMINYFPRSTFYGISDIVPAIGAITGDISRRDYNISFFSNYGIPAYLVYITGDFDPGTEDPTTKMTPLETAISDKFKELAKNPQSVMIVAVPKKDNSMGEVKIEIKPISTEIKEASFRMYRIDNRDEVITAHGVPPYRLGIFETGQLSGNLGKESTIIYNDSIIIPKQKLFEEFMNFYVFPTLGITDWRWELVSIDTRDEDLEIDRCVKLITGGMMTPNQGIAHVGNRYRLEQVEDNPAMDMHYMNGIPIDAGGFIPEFDIASMLDGLKSKLVEVFIEDVRKRYPKDDDRNRAFQKIITGLQESPKSNNRRGK